MAQTPNFAVTISCRPKGIAPKEYVVSAPTEEDARIKASNQFYNEHPEISVFDKDVQFTSEER